jgi:hypothetical protein
MYLWSTNLCTLVVALLDDGMQLICSLFYSVVAVVEPCLCIEHKAGQSPYICYNQKCKIQIVRKITIKDLILLLSQKDILCCYQII